MCAQKPAAGQAYSTFAWGSIHEGRSKRHASYLIATTSAATLLLHLLMFDVKSMHYVLQTSNVQLPSRGFVRRYIRSQFSGNYEQVYCSTKEGDLAVFNVPNAVFRTTLNVRRVEGLLLPGSELGTECINICSIAHVMHGSLYR